ncbi:Ser/Thr protein phosphatase [Histomonas meleagridis]|uniref:Ser/Thr protein phosphatase n=1 Tax=Histomonas meleagridis TaxID=135588 RepID=UPI00355A75E2|nr:Ser/Thr protein phosphatase [Histomonas meleagridis]KAH0805004.1 Ser/Thr protein phosphatase [Histomonas meleagridis]
MNSNQIFQQILNIYKNIASIDIHKYETKEVQLTFPLIPAIVIQNLCQRLEEIFKNEPTCLEIECNNIIVVGDIHGHILDLFRILSKFGFPPQQKYLFLGDLVDRGPFSLETITLVSVMKYLYPNDVYILRGNHEFTEVCARSGFLDETFRMFHNKSIFDYFLDAFSYIPLAAILNHKILCAHGGIGPSLLKIEQIKSIQRPIVDFSDSVVSTLLWSDPNKYSSGFEPSHRGIGYLYGTDAMNKFLENNNLTLFIRGHECVSDGIEFNGKGVTVFSASFYCGKTPNRSGVIKVNAEGESEVFYFRKIQYLKRSDASHEAYPLGRCIQTIKSFDFPVVNNRLPLISLGKTLPAFYNTARPATRERQSTDEGRLISYMKSKKVNLGKASFRIPINQYRVNQARDVKN